MTLTVPLGAANVYFGYFYDLRINGSYFQLAADYTIPVTDWLSLVPSVQTGYGIDYYTGTGGPTFAPPAFGTQASGFTHTLFSLAAPIKLTKSATLTPYTAWNFAWQTRNYMNATADNELFGGVKLSIAFQSSRGTGSPASSLIPLVGTLPVCSQAGSFSFAVMRRAR